MRVLLDCRMASWSGVGRYSRGIARALARRPDIEVLQVVAAGESPPVPTAEAVTAAGGPFTLSGARELAALVDRTSPDLTHCLHFPTPVPAPHPLVVTLHDISPLVVPGVMPSALKRTAYRWWNRRALRQADAVIAVSASTAADLATFAPAAASRVRVILEAADDFTSGPVGDLPDGLLGLRYVLSFGNPKPHKDLPTLLRAFASLAEDDPGLHLVLVGPEVPGLVDPMLEGRVLFTGAVEDDALRALYTHAQAFAFPSTYEGFGLPPLEAMAMGTPVVVADAASLPEVVGDDALLFPAGDSNALAQALRTLLADAGLRTGLVARGRQRAAEFTWARTAAETASLYRSVL